MLVATTIFFSPSTLKIEVNRSAVSSFLGDFGASVLDDEEDPVAAVAAAATTSEEEEDEDEEDEEDEMVDPCDEPEDPLPEVVFIFENKKFGG